MPLGPHSTARLLVMARTADFAIAEGTVNARPVMVEVERMLSTTPLCPLRSSACPRRACIHRAMQRRRQHCVRGAKRQLLGLRDEGRGGIVDENIERCLAPDRIHHGLDIGAVANVASDRGDLAAGIAPHPGRRRFQQFEPPAANTRSAPSSRKRHPIAAPSPEPPPVTNIRFPLSRPFSNIRKTFRAHASS